MHAIFLLLALSMASALFAQDSAAVARSRWRIGVSGWYGAGYRQLVSDASDATTDAIIKLRNDIEEPAPNMGFSLDILFDLGGRWGLSSGCQYVDIGYRTRSLPLTTAMDPEGLSGATAQIDYRYRYLSIPLLARYRIGNDRFRFEPALGLSGDVLLTAISKVEITERDGSTSNSSSTIATDRLRTLILSGMIELNLLYALGEQWQLRLAPTGRQHLLWMSDSPVTERLNAVSLSIGIVHRL